MAQVAQNPTLLRRAAGARQSPIGRTRDWPNEPPPLAAGAQLIPTAEEVQVCVGRGLGETRDAAEVAATAHVFRSYKKVAPCSSFYPI